MWYNCHTIYMKGVVYMTDKERTDFLIEWLTSLYRIEKSDPENEVTKKEIEILEFRLMQLGCSDFTKLK